MFVTEGRHITTAPGQAQSERCPRTNLSHGLCLLGIADWIVNAELLP
jgi:hypothetical protein